MILGMSTATFTYVHVLLSLAGIASGFVVLAGLLTGKRRDRSTALFLATTAPTSLTGFGFPFDHLLPSHKIGILSLLVLTVAITARYGLHLVGIWRSMYVVSAMIALYFNVFVAFVQAFLKVPSLRALAPTQSEPPFLAAQLVVLMAFIVLGIFAVKRFRTEPVRAAAAAAK